MPGSINYERMIELLEVFNFEQVNGYTFTSGHQSLDDAVSYLMLELYPDIDRELKATHNFYKAKERWKSDPSKPTIRKKLELLSVMGISVITEPIFKVPDELL
jgi:hypothetical protein